MDHILVPIDGSPLSRKALQYALSNFPEADVTVLHVVDLFEPGYGAHPDFETSYEPLMGSEAWYERAEKVSEDLFEDAEVVAQDYDSSVSTETEIGDPKRVIVEYTEDEAVDQLVLGAHGRTEGERPVFGSNVELVVRRAPVPVTVVR